MRQDRVEIEQDPRGIFVSVDSERSQVFFLGGFDHYVGDRLHLPIGLTFADQEVIGDRGLAANADDDRLPRLLADSRTAQQPGKLQGCRAGGLQQRNYPAYRRCAVMYRSITAGTMPPIGSPALTARRISLAETSGVGSRHRITPSPARPADFRSPSPGAPAPGRPTTTTDASARTSCGRCHVGNKPAASQPRMRNSSSEGCSRRSSVNVST